MFHDHLPIRYVEGLLEALRHLALVIGLKDDIGMHL